MKRARIKPIRINVPEDQSPLFVVEGTTGGTFASLLWNWGAPLDVPVDQLLRLLRSAPPGTIIIGRRLSSQELRALRERRIDSDGEQHSYLITRDEDRWAPRKSGRK